MHSRMPVSILAAAAIASALAAGCDHAAVSELEDSMAAEGAASMVTTGRDRPFKGSLDGVANFNMSGRADRCRTTDLPFVTESAGSGTATHLGRLTWSSAHCTELPAASSPPPYFVFERGETTIVGANGDEVRIEYTGEQNDPLDPMNPLPMELVLHCIITGGTGRFKDATGSFEMRGEVRLPAGGMEAPDWPVHFEIEGRIRY